MAFPPFHPQNSAPRPDSMSGPEFLAAFPTTETTLVERKTGVSRGPLADSVVGLSITEGGVILIGVDDAGNIVGRELTQGMADDTHEVVSTIRDPGGYTLQPLRVDGMAVAVLTIAKRS